MWEMEVVVFLLHGFISRLEIHCESYTLCPQHAEHSHSPLVPPSTPITLLGS